MTESRRSDNITQKDTKQVEFLILIRGSLVLAEMTQDICIAIKKWLYVFVI